MNGLISFSVETISKKFGAIQALDKVSMKFGNDKMHGVIGPEGAGKTTLMRIILGLLRPAEGQVQFFRDEETAIFEDVRASIAYMPQQQSLYADLSIGEHLDFFKELYGIPDEEYKKKSEELLQITRLKEFVDRPAGKLSGGMYKKLGLMCALLRSPKVMLLDEPTNGVDPISRREFWELLYRLSDQRILIIITTAYMDEAERCGLVHLLTKGKVVAEGEPRDLLKAENVRSFDELFLKGEPMTDRSQGLAVEVKNLKVQFGDFFAVNDISFNVNRGEIFGFLGANGAGKTTTIRVLCGLLNPTAGSVSVAGTGLHDGEMAIKAKVGYMSQKFTLYNDLTVEENLDFIAALRRIDRDTYIKRREDLFKFISFDRPVKTVVQDLPGGIKQQVSLAAALLHDPEIIFLDEPTAGVSPMARNRFWALIRQLAERKKTVFVTTHYMDEAEQCGRIALMRDGKIIALDTPEGLKTSTFPMDVFEFEPRENLSFAEISAMAHESAFLFFEPYGLRFHASVKNATDWDKIKAKYEKKFNIVKIKPSLEDVFIRSVEAKKQ